jgi:hypothetical protein
MPCRSISPFLCRLASTVTILLAIVAPALSRVHQGTPCATSSALIALKVRPGLCLCASFDCARSGDRVSAASRPRLFGLFALPSCCGALATCAPIWQGRSSGSSGSTAACAMAPACIFAVIYKWALHRTRLSYDPPAGPAPDRSTNCHPRLLQPHLRIGHRRPTIDSVIHIISIV